jgi:acetolactate synthase-1/2/3 large subunit
MSTQGMSGAEALLRTLRKMGVERIFASPGSDWAPLWEALAKDYAPGEIPEYLSSRHEETAVAMATGYAKATGKLPAVVLHTTVGALHATMGLRAALHERVPMVVFAGESVNFSEPPAPEVGRQWLRLLSDVGGPARLMEHCVKWSVGLNAGALLPHIVQRACQLAMSYPKGPVFASIPTEMLIETMRVDAPAAAGLPRAPAAQPAALDELAQILCAASSPMIITEELGKDQAAVPQLVALAETLGAPVIEAWQPYYVNFPRRHPLYGGVAAAEIGEVIRDADLLLLVECVGPWHPPSSLPRQNVKVVALGEDPLHPHLPFWGFRADLVVAGDPGASLAMLADRVKRRIPAGSRAGAAAHWSEVHGRRRAAWNDEARASGSSKAIDTRWVVHELREVLPRDAIVVNETITHRLDIVRLLDALEPGAYYEASYGGLGMGLGLALGVKTAQPGRTLVALIGDGAFHYNPVVASFGAAQEHGLPMLVVLFDNAGYLSQKRDVMHEYPKGAAMRAQKFAGTSIQPRPDYALLARAYGGVGERVEEPREVRAALERGLEAVAKGRLALVDVVLEPVNADKG